MPQVVARLKRLDDPRILNDTLAPFGVMLTERPLTPERVRRALGRAR